MNKVLIPRAARYYLKYRKNNGQIHSYSVSAPLEERGDLVICYAFRKGPRSFHKENIISFTRTV